MVSSVDKMLDESVFCDIIQNELRFLSTNEKRRRSIVVMPLGAAFHGINYKFQKPSADAPKVKPKLLFTSVRVVHPDADDPVDVLEVDFASREEGVVAPEGGDEDLPFELWGNSEYHLVEIPPSEFSVSDGEPASLTCGASRRTLVLTRADRYRDEKKTHRKHHTTYMPDGVPFVRFVRIESHGLHGRKCDTVSSAERREVLRLKGHCD
jgi:hypothetical protein